MLCVVAGMGWLYLLRTWHVLDVGPVARGALPLQQLAGDDGQPLARMVVAWLPAGYVAGMMVRSQTRVTAVVQTVLLAAVVLVVTGALSDGIVEDSGLSSYLSAQFSRPGTWVAVALMGIGALTVTPRGRRPEQEAPPAPRPH